MPTTPNPLVAITALSLISEIAYYHVLNTLFTLSPKT